MSVQSPFLAITVREQYVNLKGRRSKPVSFCAWQLASLQFCCGIFYSHCKLSIDIVDKQDNAELQVDLIWLVSQAVLVFSGDLNVKLLIVVSS